MADRFALTVTGGERLQAAFLKLGAKAPEAMGEALWQFGNLVMQESKAHHVPVDTGALRASGFVEQPVRSGSSVSVRFGYGGAAAPYALWVHENPRAGKTQGVSPSGRPYAHWARVGEWKFLETPLKARARKLSDLVARALTRMIAAQKPTKQQARGFRFR